MSLLSGESGSTLGSISEIRYFDARPRWPRYSSAHFILSGSVVQVPFVRFTRRTLLCHDMVTSSSLRVRLIISLRRPHPHSFQPRPIRIDISDGAGRTGLSAPRIAAAEVTLHNLARIMVVVDGAERTGDGADLAPDAHILEDDF